MAATTPGRNNLDVSTVGQAVIVKAIQGTGITLSSTGADAGTGDVTISIVVPVAVINGGTGLTTVAQGDLLFGSAANTIQGLAKNASTTRYIANTGIANNPAWAQVSLTNGVTGLLPIGNIDVSTNFNFTSGQTVTIDDSETAGSSVPQLNVVHTTTGTAANALGASIAFLAESSALTAKEQCRISSGWSTVTDASRSGYLDFTTVNNASGTVKARIHASGGLSVGSTTDPGVGIISANTGFWAGTSAPASGKILKSDGSKFGASTETYDAPGTAGSLFVSDGTNWKSKIDILTNASTAQQQGFASDTMLTGSIITVPAGIWTIGTTYKCVWDMQKTAAGVAILAINVRIGTGGAITDTAVWAYTTGSAGTANTDQARFEVLLIVRTIGTAATIISVVNISRLDATAVGFVSNAFPNIPGIGQATTTFNSTTATKIGVSINGGSLFVGTTQLVQAELNIA